MYHYVGNFHLGLQNKKLKLKGTEKNIEIKNERKKVDFR